MLHRYVLLFLVLMPSILPIELNFQMLKFKKLKPQFWAHTGFCPPAPISRKFVTKFLLSNDVAMNLEYIGALPNKGLRSVRIHWLLNLVKLDIIDDDNKPVYDLFLLDRFLRFLITINVHPAVEFMTTTKYSQKLCVRKMWKYFAFVLVNRYKDLFGSQTISHWGFETWNEPDIKTYNVLNYTKEDYLNYVVGIREGLNKVEQTQSKLKLKLRGPGGLFKNREKHPLCWGLLDQCNRTIDKCNIDVITFHRKGQGTAEEIFKEGFELIQEFHRIYPALENMSYVNDEADPLSGWSNPLEMNADVQYAAVLLKTIFLHWNAKYNKTLSMLLAISHDNAFLSYHPYEFKQRTLLARFQMNITNTTQFFHKPVYSALGLMANLGIKASQMFEENGLTYLVTMADQIYPFYGAIILVASTSYHTINFNVSINGFGYANETVFCFVEAIKQGITDPYHVWQSFGSEAYPNETIREHMRRVQTPEIVVNPFDITQSEKPQLSFRTDTPAIFLIRFCGDGILVPERPTNIRIRMVNNKEVVIFWHEKFYKKRCTMTFEIFFRPIIAENKILRPAAQKWINVSKNFHVPFLSFHYCASDNVIEGHYKVRAVDVFIRRGRFSKVAHFKINNSEYFGES